MKTAAWILVLVIASAALASWAWYNTALTTDARNREEAVMVIPFGQGVSATATQLKEARLIGSPLAFKIHLRLNPEKVIQAGEYQIEPGISMRRLISRLTSGETVSREVNVLIRESLTVREANEEIKKQGYLSDDSFLRLAETPIRDLPDRLTQRPFIDEIPASATLEGYLFPDTYRLYKDFTAEDLAEKMLANFERQLEAAEIRAAAARLGRPLHEVVIMASLLEKEVRTEEDMKIVSGLFWNRLQTGQALQSCATLAYILGVNKPQYTYEDTQIPSPYNTYLHPGLPPGPVSNPGLRGLRTAAEPADTEYVYFLNRPDTGETVFSRTYDEHLAAKARYLGE